MAQRDYVKRSRTSTVRKSSANKKKQSTKNVSNTLMVFAAALLLVFAGGLYLIKHINQSDTPSKPLTRQTAGSEQNRLPPKPEDRWLYIKELENRQASMVPPEGQPLQHPSSLTEEQKKVLTQMQADMRQQNQSLPGTYNQQVTQRAHNIPNPPLAENRTRSVNSGKWYLQCGSFRKKEQAESLKAKLALSGITSHIVVNNGWHRIMLGAYATKEQAQTMLSPLKNIGVTECLTIAPK